MKAFRVLFEDAHVLVVDKPPGFHSHPPEDKNIRISRDWNGLGILERQFNQKLFLVNRLDRATSGILLLTKDAKSCASIKKQFQDRSVKKTYFCFVRGTWQGEGLIEMPLKRENGTMAEASTRVELFANFPKLTQENKAFSLVMSEPITGRFHQIRRHLAHMGLPIIGDKQHGDKKLNRAFSEETKLERMYLRCMKMEFSHPLSEEKIVVRARWSREWHALFDKIGFCGLVK